MARLEIKNNELVINVQGKRKLLALKSEITVPLSNIEAISAEAPTWKDMPNGFEKRKGANLPGVYFGGTFVQDDNRLFYDLARKEDALTITLKDEDFKQIIIGVEDPAKAVELIEGYIESSK